MRRFLVLGTQTETAWMPDYYPIIKAARYLHVAPWDLLEQSIYWKDKALICQSAEDYAEAERRKHQ